ncbi:MAG: hypothetical protein HY710_15480 [Candidatus Latescibacteria bacterium]|nr:hypothetical protein [Candidatus Latescibacterota bacterium]
MPNRFVRCAGLLGVVFTATVTAGALTHHDTDALETARRLYPPEVTRSLLVGTIPPPPGFDRAMAERVGPTRLEALRSGNEVPSGVENDAAALVLLRLNIDPHRLKPVRASRATVQFVRSVYPVARGNTSGFFRTGQDADLMLSGIDFNNAGGPLLFNHPMGIASDGTRLLLADTYNNRVLIWKTLPNGNVPPDLVLGQEDFISNNPGTGRDQMNWPVTVATDGQRILVADTDNNRILIWHHFPTKHGTPADLVLDGEWDGERNIEVSNARFHWPWGVWTNGEKMAVSSTGGGGVLIWNRFPSQDNQPADLVLRGGGKLGTPRTITSDGTRLIVGDHNPRMGGIDSGTFFWKTFPTRDDQPFDFYRTDPQRGPWLRGTFTSDGKLALLGSTLFIWNAFPEDERDDPDLAVRGFDFRPGDHTGVAAAGGRLYVVTGNINKVLVYKSLPTTPDQRPDFAIGSPDLATNTLETHFIISNPAPASNGKSLFVASDFDRKLYVWKQLPDHSGAHPDLVYTLDFGPWDIAVWQERLVLAGGRTVAVWNTLPLDGHPPDVIFDERIGSVRLEEIRGVALDDRYFYLADHRAGKVYVWKGIPSAESEPVCALNVEQAWRLSSDGHYLTIATAFRHMVVIYPVDDLEFNRRSWVVGMPAGEGRPGPRMFNGVGEAVAAEGHLFVAEGFNRVHVWRRIEDALTGKWADVLLGQRDVESIRPEIGRNRLHTPAALSFDGRYLWVGETKFSERILRFSPMP